MHRLYSIVARSIQRALRRRDGVAALEFALVASPFIFLLFAIVEIGLIFVANINLANATLALARQIRTGGIVAPGTAATSSSGVSMDLPDFKAAICNKMQIVPINTCLSQLHVDVRIQSSFSGRTAPNPLSNGTFNNSSLCYYSGSGGSITEFRAFYLWPVATPVLLSALVNASTYKSGNTITSGSFYMLVSSEVFKIEQNSSGSNNGSGC